MIEQDIELAIAAHLKPLFDARVKVEVTPDAAKKDQYEAKAAKGCVLVAYLRSSYRTATGTAQSRTMEFIVAVGAKSLRDQAGVYEMLGLVRENLPKAEVTYRQQKLKFLTVRDAVSPKSIGNSNIYWGEITFSATILNA